jgi:protein TonB
MTTLFVATVLHGLLVLGLTFDAAAGNGQAAPSLEVLLVSDELPESEQNETATYLAQRTQEGSGNTPDAVAPRNRASAMPIPANEGQLDGKTLTPDTKAPGGEEHSVLATTAQSAQVYYLANLGGEAASKDKPLQLEEERTDDPGPQDEEGPAQLRGEKRDELWVTPDTRTATLAPYLDSWRRKVERIGTMNYPTVARRADMSASPVLEVALAADGTLEEVVVRRSSGFPELDQAALEILKLASPFDAFPQDLAREHRLLRFAYEWQFVGGRMQGGSVSAAAR